MSPLTTSIVAGVAAGLVASAGMNLYQGATASLFGMDKGNGDPATVQAADTAKQAAGAPPVTHKHRQRAGSLVHYATGTALGLIYAATALHWSPVTLGFGAAFGIVVALLLDDLVVPAFGWGSPPWVTSAAGHGYSLTSHLVFGLILEGTRRLAVGLLN